MSLSVAAPAHYARAPGAAPRRAVFTTLVVAALAAGFMATSAHSEAVAIQRAGPELTRLLRGMAALKGLMTAAAFAATFWRFGTPVPVARLIAYTLAAAAMALGPGLVWGMAHLYAGSIAMNGGMIALVVVFWRDPEVARRLAAEVSRRRAQLRTGP